MSSYIHGSEPEEQARLAKLNQLINSRCLSLLEIRGGERILDVGSGLGQFTLAMAAKAGESGMCLGIERDKNQLKIAQQNLDDFPRATVEFRQGNAENLELRQEEEPRDRVVEEVAREKTIVKMTDREDAWLIDGLADIGDIKGLFGWEALPNEENYQTISGFLMSLLKKWPRKADSVIWKNVKFVVVDTEGSRIDQVMATLESGVSR